MKIIKVSNFDHETVDDILICENLGLIYGHKIVNHLNDTESGETSRYYFRLVDDDYELYRFQP